MGFKREKHSTTSVNLSIFQIQLNIKYSDISIQAQRGSEESWNANTLIAKNNSEKDATFLTT